ncbi:MAG: SDR family oxidoreductase [Candidatus Bipolaricaulota bacterium]|nr:SDR family oxidoreductase [Candidatus Bipolaricaulota bacterium]MDW8126552.1 SDR family oxidoreductase [Candidatus Bipolaricaulota bacterium]
MKRVALVTGGSRGIGAATVLRLAQMGYDVAFTYRAHAAEANAIARAVEELGHQALPVQLDLEDLSRIKPTVDEIAEKLGGLNALVNNAGYVQRIPPEELSLADWERMLRVSLTAPFLFIQAAVPHMKRAGFGRIVNVSSLRALTGSPHGVHYAAAKAGLLGLTKSYASVLAPFGITVNAVCPGFVNTDVNREQLRERGPELVRQIPVGRVAEPTEVAALIGFLCAEEAGYITGATFSINGGLRMD